MSDLAARVTTSLGDWRTAGCALLLMALPILVYGPQGWTGAIGLIWLVFALAVWPQATKARPARQTLANIGLIGMVLFPLLVIVIVMTIGGKATNVDNPSRFFLLIPVAVAVAGLSPSPRYWFLANAIGGVIGGSLALYQVLIMHTGMATGLLDNPNKFAYLSAASALACLAAFRLKPADRPPSWLLAAGGVLAIAALLLSGTRGAWLAFACASGGWFVLNRTIGWRAGCAMLAVAIIVASAVATIEGSVIAQRWGLIGVELNAYFAGNWYYSSIGERFELWRGAAIMIAENPITGVGLNSYNEGLNLLIEQGRIDRQVALHGHAHNEFLMWWSTGGILGLLGVTAALFGPLIYFVRHAARASRQAVALGSSVSRDLSRYQASAVAGSLITIQTLVFCLFDAFLFIQFATVCYVLTVFTLMGLVEASRE